MRDKMPKNYSYLAGISIMDVGKFYIALIITGVQQTETASRHQGVLEATVITEESNPKKS